MWLLVLALLLLFHGGFSQEVGRVEKYSGKVDLVMSGELRGVPVGKAGGKLSVGDILRTKFKSYAFVSFVDGSRVEVFELSRLKVLDYKVFREVNVERGVVKFEVVSKKGVKGFRVNTRHAIIGVKGTVFWVYVLPGYTKVIVEKGKVDVSYKLKLPNSKWQVLKASKLLIIPEPYGDKPPNQPVSVRVTVQ